ncbi:MAG: transposase, partial [Verrucomicrobia bacterium]|nr:transposase [Deltaproteobacteria bacterium]
ITTVPEKYNWSSHRAYLGKESLSWLETDFILSQFSTNLKRARNSFATFVISHAGGPRRKEFHGEENIDNRIFGDDLFVTSVLEAAEALPVERPDICAVIAAIKKIYEIGDEELAGTRRDAFTSEARALAAWATLELSSGKLTDLAKYLKRAPSTMTSGVRRIEKLSQSHRIAENMIRVRTELGYQVIES